MTLERAIKLIQKDIAAPGSVDIIELNKAVKLGSEALKQVKESRFDPSTWIPQPLPGETKD